MASFNRVILMGNLTRDPQVRYTSSQTAVADLGLAVSHVWFDKVSNQKREEVTFVDVTCWGRTAEIAGEYLSKGKPVLIEGRLKLDQWDDKTTGQKRSKLVVVCENLKMVGSRTDGQGQGQNRGPSGGGASGSNSGGGRPAPQQQPEPDPADRYYDDMASGPPPGDEVPF
jgi:single-strand DNA-binding protein